MKPLRCFACFTFSFLLLAALPAPACEDHASASGSKHSCEGGASCKHSNAKAGKGITTVAATTTTTSTTTTTAKADGQNYKMNVDGLHCQNCVDALKAKLETMEDVVKDSLKVDIKGKTAMITLKKGSKSTASIDELKKTLNTQVTESGFTVTDVKVVN